MKPGSFAYTHLFHVTYLRPRVSKPYQQLQGTMEMLNRGERVFVIATLPNENDSGDDVCCVLVPRLNRVGYTWKERLIEDDT